MDIKMIINDENRELDLHDAEELYKACKTFTATYEFGQQCSDRKGMYQYLEGIQMDLKDQREKIIQTLGIDCCPFIKQGEKE